jgi:predicted permease
VTDWRAHVRRHLPPLAISPERELEIVEELAQQFEAAYDDALSRGLSDGDAQAVALREVPDWNVLGASLTSVERPIASHLPTQFLFPHQQTAVGAARGGFMSGFIQDVRYAIRALRRAPGFATVAISTLALGIGATTIVYSLVDGILLKPLPIADPDRVMFAREVTATGEEMSVSWPNFIDWRNRVTSFENFGVWRGIPANLTGIDRPRRIMVRQLSWNMFHVLGVKPVIGRDLTAADDQYGVDRVCLVSFGFWQRELGGNPAAIGRRVVLDDVPVTVIGVLPADFSIAREEDAFLPFGNFLAPDSFHHARGNHTGLAAIGRLGAGVSIEAARAELTTIAAQLALEHPETNSGQSATMRPLFEVLVSDVRPTLGVLFGAVLAMLLIACANLANLLLARSSGRAQELAVRRALGAAAWRIARQLLTESVLVALCGGVAGALLAWAGFGAVLALLPSDQPRVHVVALDLRVLAVAGAVSIITGILFGLVPSLHAATGRSLSLLRTSRVTTGASGKTSTKKALLVAEVSLALMLLAGAGLMVRTMSNLLSVDPGFRSEGVISAQVSLPPSRYTVERRRAFYDAVLERALAKPGVTHTAFTISLPVQGSNWNSVFVVSDQPVPARADLPSAAFTPVSPAYHQTMGIRLVQGRLLLASDGPDSATVAVVNERFARRFWPDGNALGNRVKQGWPEDRSPWREIVGIVSDVKTAGVDQPAALQVYLPLAQNPSTSVALVMRTSGSAASLANTIESTIHEVDPDLPVYDTRTLDEVIGRGVGQQRLTTVFLVGFATLALVMAGVGVFGVTAYSVSQRTHELGVRMALGADRSGVLMLVLRQELAACAIGIVLGFAGALALSSVLQTLVFGVPTRDPATLAVVSVVLMGVTAVAGYLPARRATRIDPVTAMRTE